MNKQERIQVWNDTVEKCANGKFYNASYSDSILYSQIPTDDIELLKKYDNDVSDEQYLNDVGLLKYWNKTICEFLGNKRFSG